MSKSNHEQPMMEEKLFNQIDKTTKKLPNSHGFLDRFLHKGATPEPQKDWVIDAEWAKIQQKPLRAQRLLYVIALSILALLLWAAYAPIDEITRGSGKVIPSQKLQTIQSLDGGIIQNILIKEGQVVSKGNLLLQIDPTRSESSLSENASQSYALQAEIIRLKALTNQTELRFPEKLVQLAPDIIERQTELYQANLSEYQETQKILRSQLFQRQQALQETLALKNQTTESIRLLDQELKAVKPLLSIGAVSEVEVLRLERQLNDLRGEAKQTDAQIRRHQGAIREARNKISELTATKVKEWREQLLESSAQLATLNEAAKGLQDRVKQTDIRAPVNGTVQRLLSNTIGGVVTPGETIIEIIPMNDELIVESKIAPKDIAFIRLNQPAVIKFSAYDFSIYGGVDAKVINISADTVTDEEGHAFYLVKLQTNTQNLNPAIEVIPGMTAQTDIITGKKTVLEYLLKPLLRAYSNALTER